MRVVVRPTPETPLILLTQADGAVVALSAVRSGLRTDGVIASSPQIAEPPEKALLGPVKRASKPPPGWKPWAASAPTTSPPAEPTTPGADRSATPG